MTFTGLPLAIGTRPIRLQFYSRGPACWTASVLVWAFLTAPAAVTTAQDDVHRQAGAADAGQTTDARGLRVESEGAATDAARWMPRHTIAMARFADVDQFRQQWKQSSFGAQLDDPAFATFFQGVADRWRQASQGSDLDLIRLWQDIEGEFSLGVLPDESGGLSVVAVADLGSEQAAGQAIERMENNLKASSGEPTRVSVGETELTSWRRNRDGVTSRLSYFRSGNQIVFSDTLQTLAETARLGSAAPASASKSTLGGDDVFDHVMDRITPEGDSTGINWYVNPSGVIRAAATNMTGGAQPAAIAAMTQKLGLEQFKGFGGSFWLGQGGMDSVSSTYGYVDTPVDGFWKAFVMPATQQQPPNWVKDDVSIYSQVNWSGARFFDAVGELVDRAGGEGTWQRTVGTTKVGGTDMTVAEVAAQLSGPLHIAAKIPETAQQLTRQEAIFAMEINDTQAIRNLVAAIAAETAAEKLPGGTDQTDVYRMQLDTSQFPAVPPLELAVTVTDKTLMFSPNAKYLQETLQNADEGRPLSQSPSYQEIASQFPSQTAMITYQKQDGRIEGLYEQLRSGLIGGSGLPGLAGQLLNFDFQKLPPFPAMSRYLQSTGSFVVPREDGFQIVSFATPPREQ